MTVSITEDIKTVSDLKKHTKEIFKQLHRTGRPIVITVNGRPDVVVLDAEQFEKKLKVLNLAVLLSEAEADIRAGRVRPAGVALSELRNAGKVSR
jgi:prevent-host-death family protein